MNKLERAKRGAVTRGVLAGIERAAALGLRRKADVALVVSGEVLRALEAAGYRVTRKPREEER